MVKNKMDSNEVLKKMHSLHLMLADELKRICEKHDIRYFMIAGSLLGAIRHGGFIPWDDDMDFGMLREDFDKFLTVCEMEIDQNVFYLLTEMKEIYYPFNIAKLTLKGTTFQEDFVNKNKLHEGIYIDIFPIDVVPDSRLKKCFQFKTFNLARSLLKVKTGVFPKSRLDDKRYYVARIIAVFFPIKFLKGVKHRSISRYAGMDSIYVVTSDGAYGMEKETLQRKWTDSLKNYNFEDRIYPGIAEYDDYLSYFYGDYMQVVPEDQRNHHHRLMVDFGTYCDGENNL